MNWGKPNPDTGTHGNIIVHLLLLWVLVSFSKHLQICNTGVAPSILQTAEMGEPKYLIFITNLLQNTHQLIIKYLFIILHFCKGDAERGEKRGNPARPPCAHARPPRAPGPENCHPPTPDLANEIFNLLFALLRTPPHSC